MQDGELEVTQGLPEGETVVETPAIENAPATGTEQAPEQPVEEDPKPRHKPWFQERIDQVTREKYEEKRRADALEATLAEIRKADPDKPIQAGEIDRLAAARVDEMLKARQFDDKCNEVYSSGKTEFQDFDDTIANFRMLGGLPVPVLEAVNQLPDAHKVLYALGQDMDEAARILSLAPVPMAVALAKLSMSPAKAKPVSNAPPPIRTIDASPRGEKSPEDMTTAEWIKWREDSLKS
jgi:hypothetical protein